LPPYHPYLATSNISHNTIVNTNYNGQCSKKALFTASDGKIWYIAKVFPMMTSSSISRQQQLASGICPSAWGIVHIAIEKEACGGEKIGNARSKQP